MAKEYASSAAVLATLLAAACKAPSDQSLANKVTEPTPIVESAGSGESPDDNWVNYWAERYRELEDDEDDGAILLDGKVLSWEYLDRELDFGKVPRTEEAILESFQKEYPNLELFVLPVGYTKGGIPLVEGVLLLMDLGENFPRQSYYHSVWGKPRQPQPDQRHPRPYSLQQIQGVL